MHRGVGAAVFAALVTATFVIHADQTPPHQTAAIQLHIGQLLFDEGRYSEALEAYQKAAAANDPGALYRARVGVVQSALRVAEFALARTEAEHLITSAPRDTQALTLSGDSLWRRGC